MKYKLHHKAIKALTLRDISPKLERAIRERAAKARTSFNRVVLGLLEEHLGLGGGRVLHHDLDHLAGSWSREEGQAFDKALAAQRRIDPELWK